MKYIIVVVGVIILVGAGLYVFTHMAPQETRIPNTNTTTIDTTANTDQDTASSTDEKTEEGPESVIGKSVEGRDITAYHYGSGDTELLFVGGIHGGYEWNTSLVAYELMDYLKEKPDMIPASVRVTVIPVLNPDGLVKVSGKEGRFSASDITASADTQVAGRFNARSVDLNRNFDCDWQAKGTWQQKTVSGGESAFSEPESKAIQSYITSHSPEAVVVWYSAAGGVFSSNCHNGVSEETTTLTNLYAKASGYKAYETFNFYEITGDMVNWLAKQGVPAISVLLSNHNDVEWDKNRAGVEALLKHYAE